MKKQAEGKQKVQREGKGFKDWEARKLDIIKDTKTSFFAAVGRPEDFQDSDKSGLEDDSYADRKEKVPAANRRETEEPRVVKKDEERPAKKEERPVEKQEEVPVQKEEVGKQENVQKEEKQARVPSAKKEEKVEKVQGVEGQGDLGHAGTGASQDEAKTPEKSLSQSGSQGGAGQ